MRRREFMTGLGSATIAWPLVARAQQKSMPVVGVLSSSAPDLNEPNISAPFVRSCQSSVTSRAATFCAQGRCHPLTAGGTLAALAAKQATTTLPIVFGVVGDPLAEGLVTSLARPGALR